MNLEKFTERSRGFVQAAQTIAMRENHQRLLPEHLLKALMDDPEGLAANLIARAAGDAQAVRDAVNAAVAKVPRVTGDAGQVYADNLIARVLDEALLPGGSEYDGTDQLTKDGSFNVIAKDGLAVLKINGIDLLDDEGELIVDPQKVEVRTSPRRSADGT